MQMLKYLEYKLDRIWIEKQNRGILCHITVYFVL